MADSPEPTVQPDAAQPATVQPDIEEILRSVRHLEPNDRLQLIVRLWTSLPPEYWAAPTSDQRADIMRHVNPGTAGSLSDVPWRIVNVISDRHTKVVGSKTYSAPRRFDLATIFVVTTAYCLLFALLSATTWPSVVSVIIAGFITLVGVGQALLYGGQRPRKASVMVGIALFCIGTFWSLVNYPSIVMMGGRPTRTPPFGVTPAMLIDGLIYSVVGGTVCGYLAGTVVGGVFLIIDRVRQRFSRPPQTEPDAPASVPTAPAFPESS